MKTQISSILAVCVSLALFGCPPDEPDAGGPDMSDRGLDRGVADGGDMGPSARLPRQAREWLERANEENWRYFRFVDFCDPGRCALNDAGWQTSRLFEADSEQIDDMSANDDRRYMLFEWTLPDDVEDPDAARDLAARALAALDGVVWNLNDGIELFPTRVSPMALEDDRAADGEVWRSLGGALQEPLSADPAVGTVQVVVLDTVAGITGAAAQMTDRDALVNAGRALHGVDLAAIIQEAACGWAGGRPGAVNAACPVKVDTRVALDLQRATTQREPDWGGFVTTPDGGSFGDPGGVARAVQRATDEWLHQEPQTRPALILVLSLGWPVLDDESPSSDAARLALDYARCNGALVVPAFGNADMPDDARGPLRPAAFPLPADCGQFRFDNQVAKPLVTVAGVRVATPADADPTLLPLHNARPWSPTVEPTAFAWGDGVRAHGSTPRWSGSSMAAGLYAAAAAVQWVMLADADRPTGVVGADLVVNTLHQLTLAQDAIVRPCAVAGQCAPIPALEVGEMGVFSPVTPPACGPAGNMPCRNILFADRVDPQPDVPSCSVCQVELLAGADQIKFTLLANYASWPDSNDLIHSAYLKISYTTGQSESLDLISIGGSDKLDHIRDDIDGVGAGFYEHADLTLTTDVYSKIQDVTLVGVRTNSKTGTTSFAESVYIKP